MTTTDAFIARRRTYHVLTEAGALSLGIIDEQGAELEHSATLAQVAAAAESSHATQDEAIDACAATGEDRWIIDEDGDSQWVGAEPDAADESDDEPAPVLSDSAEDEPSEYTYTIFDSNPHVSGDSAWPTRSDVEIEADSLGEALSDVQDALDSAAKGCSEDDGYTVGQRLYVLVWDADGVIVGELHHDLTAEDLGIEPSVCCCCCGGHLPADRDSHLRDDTTDRTGRVLGCGAYEAEAYRAEPESEDEPDGYLHDYDTAEVIRSATVEECRASREAAKGGGGAGVITVDGRRCYVQE